MRSAFWFPSSCSFILPPRSRMRYRTALVSCLSWKEEPMLEC